MTRYLVAYSALDEHGSSVLGSAEIDSHYVRVTALALEQMRRSIKDAGNVHHIAIMNVIRIHDE